MTDPLLQRLTGFAEAALDLQGWQLDYEPEPLVPGPPWDYEALAGELCAQAGSVLDLGTGGGEVLSRVLSASTCRAVATEGWVVNAPVAARRLGRRAAVVRASSLSLPVLDGTFDVVLSRHEEISPAQVRRVLAPGGCLLTQQMVPDLWHELRAVFPDMARFPDHCADYRREFVEAGLTVEDARQFRRPVRFREVGHLVYHLAAAPWTIPGFSVASHLDGLARLDRQARSQGGVVLTEGFYLLRVRDTAPTPRSPSGQDSR